MFDYCLFWLVVCVIALFVVELFICGLCEFCWRFVLLGDLVLVFVSGVCLLFAC